MVGGLLAPSGVLFEFKVVTWQKGKWCSEKTTVSQAVDKRTTHLLPTPKWNRFFWGEPVDSPPPRRDHVSFR